MAQGLTMTAVIASQSFSINENRRYILNRKPGNGFLVSFFHQKPAQNLNAALVSSRPETQARPNTFTPPTTNTSTFWWGILSSKSMAKSEALALVRKY